MNLPLSINSIVILLLAGIATVTDLRARRIPNWLVAAGITVALPIQFASNGALPGLGALSAGAAVGLALFLPGYWLRMMGAGDVKLMMAIGALLGPLDMLRFSLFTYAFGGVCALLALLWRRQLRAGFNNIRLMLTTALVSRQHSDAKQLFAASVATTGSIPYAVPIAITAVYLLLLNP